MATVAAQTAHLMYYSTAYEIAVTGTDGKSYLLGYSEPHTKRAIEDMFFRHRAKFLPLIDGSAAKWEKAQKAFVSSTWRIGFTGRTQRQALIDGELPRLSRAA